MDMLFQIQRLGNDLNPAAQLRIQKGHQRRAHAAGRTAPDRLHVDLQRRLNDVGIMRQITIQLDDHRLGRPFLWAKDPRRATLATSGLVTSQATWIILSRKRGSMAERSIRLRRLKLPPPWPISAVGVAEAGAQRLHHTRATVVGRTAADADNDPFRPMIQRL
jgi:hypothetical protein